MIPWPESWSIFPCFHPHQHLTAPSASASIIHVTFLLPPLNTHLPSIHTILTDHYPLVVAALGLMLDLVIVQRFPLNYSFLPPHFRSQYFTPASYDSTFLLETQQPGFYLPCMPELTVSTHFLCQHGPHRSAKLDLPYPYPRLHYHQVLLGIKFFPVLLIVVAISVFLLINTSVVLSW